MQGESLEVRLWRNVDKNGPNGCWLWTGYIDPEGYGDFYADPEHPNEHVHRTVYRLSGRSIPKGFHVDHLCRVRHCVNPDHLEAVTNRENVLRGIGPTAINARKTHCPQGHEYTPENTIRGPKGRECRACRVVINRRQYQARLQKRIAHWNATGKCLRHFSIDDPPLFCEQCGKPWSRVMDGRVGRKRRLQAKAKP